MFKICAIGCGYIAKNGHGPAFLKYKNEHSKTVLAGCCDIKSELAKEFKNTFGFEAAYTDYKQMLNEIKPDAVSLMSPVYLTSSMAVEILNMGYPLILEKPPGRNKDEISAIYYAAKKSGVSVRTAFNRRYTPLVLKLKELLKDEKIYNITYQMYRKNRADADFSTTSIHAIDCVSNIAGGSYKRVDFNYQEIPEVGENVANIYLNGILENGAVAQISLVPMGGTVAERISVNTNKAAYFVELPFWSNVDSPGCLVRIDGNEITHRILGDELVSSPEMFEESGFYEENRSFFEYVRSGGKVVNDILSGIDSVEIADCIRKRLPFYEVKK